jgi:His/Glu/Gln/Arg/opine family amino acid ABC transporter permease subunit
VSSVAFYTEEMLRGAIVTIELTAVGTGVSLVAGAVGAIGRVYGPRPVRLAIGSFVEAVRGLPPILLLFVFYFGLTQFSIDLSSLSAGLVWMCVYGTGYAIEIFRAGLLAVPDGQHEAATALGLGRIHAFRKVIIPQAVAAMLPPLISFVILELKNTTLVYFIGVHDIMYQANVGADNSRSPLAIYVIAAAIYVVLNGACAQAGAVFERRAAALR